jgi:hypothetical protein
MVKDKNVAGKLKSRLKQTILYDGLIYYRSRIDTRKKKVRDNKDIENWMVLGCPVPPPDAVKQRVVREYGKQFSIKVLVETGTCLGDMISAVKDCFLKIYSMELDEALFQRAKIRFTRDRHVLLMYGDSGEILPMVLAEINQPCLFWLDAHYSGGFTARGELETPVLKELESILEHRVRGHVILIDDARCFTGENDYPKVEKLRAFVNERWSDAIFSIEDDIIRIHPRM